MIPQFALRNLSVWVTFASLGTLFSVCVWQMRREGVSDFLLTFSAITAFVTGAAITALAMAVAVKRFARFTPLLLRYIGWRATLGSFAILFLVFYCVSHIQSEAISDVLYLFILITAVLTLIAITALKGVLTAARGETTIKRMLACIGLGLSPIVPPFGILLPFGLLAIIYGMGGYFALRMGVSSSPGEPDATPNDGPTTECENSGATAKPPSVS